MSSRDRRSPSFKPVISRHLAILRWLALQVLQLGPTHSLALLLVAQMLKARRARQRALARACPEPSGPAADPGVRLPARRSVR